jgi:hypothetical protein
VRDKHQSIYMGRHSRLRHSDCNVQLLFLDDFEELQPFNTYTYSPNQRQLGTPARSISPWEQLCRLSTIAESILANIRSEWGRTASATALVGLSEALQKQLDEWMASLPAHLRLGCKEFETLPHTLSLM